MTRSKDFIFIFGIVLVIVFGSLLRIVNLGGASLRLDEAQSVWQASHSLSYIVWYMAQNVHLPLHNTLLHYWIQYFGTSETSVRIMAVIPGILSLPVLYLLAKEILISRYKAFVALVIGALSPFWIWYSREIRMYTLLTLITGLSYLFYLKIIKNPKLIFIVLYTLVNIVGVYTHYLFNFVLLSQVLYFFLAKYKGWYPELFLNGKNLLKKFILSGLVTFVAFLPWIVYFVLNHKSGSSFNPTIKVPNSFNIVLSFFEFTFGYQPEYVTAAAIAFWPLVILLGFIFLNRRKNPLTPSFYLVFLGAFLPIITAYAVSVYITPMYLTRYLITATPLFYILLAWLLTEIKGWFGSALTGVFFGFMILALNNQTLNQDIPNKEDYRGALAYITSNVGPRDVVVASPPYTIYPVYYYYGSQTKLTTLPIWDRTQLTIPEISDTQLKTDSTIIQQGHKRIFLLATLDLDGGYAAKQYFDTHYKKLDQKQFSKYVWVEVYQAEYPI